MCAQRLWPTVHALGRGLLSNRQEFLQQGVKAYNVQNFNSNHLGQQQQQQHFHGQGKRFWQHSFSRNAQGSFNKIFTQNINSGSVQLAKEFHDSENEHAHDVLRSLPAYSETTVARSDLKHIYQHPPSNLKIPPGQWQHCSAQDVANSFITLSQQCRIRPMNLEDSCHSELCGVLTAHLPSLSDSHVTQVLSALSLWPPTRSTVTQNFVTLWNALDKICSERMNNWNIGHMFLVADHWFTLRLSRITMYNLKMTTLLGRRVKTMKPSELVQFLFYANLSRKLEPFILMSELEHKLCEVLKDISVEELGVISMGFFKTQTFLKNVKLMDAFLKLTLDNLETVSDASLCAILKVLRKSLPVSKCKDLYDFLDALIPQLPRLNQMCLLQVALIGNDLLVFHPKVINLIAVNFSENINTIRLKDIERITFALMLYNFIPPSKPDIFEIISNELRRPERIVEINHYPKCFVSCVVYLVTMGVFPLDLISAALQPSMLSLLHLNHHYVDMDREVNELDWALEIEGPKSYKGHRLNPALRYEITKKYIDTKSKHGNKVATHQEKLLLDVQDKLSSLLGGSKYIQVAHVLPHVQNPDLVFCTTPEGEPVPIPEDFACLEKTSLKIPVCLEQQLFWNAVIIAGRNSFIRDTNSLRGIIHMKKRQLTRLGYNVSVVPFMEYSRKSLSQKFTCLENVLQKGSTLNASSKVESAVVNIRARALYLEQMK